MNRKIESIADYQKEACKRWAPHPPLTPRQATILNWAIGIPGECGEITELIKHDIFGNEPIDKMELAKELGDIQWYINALAAIYDIPMESILALNVAKLEHRHNGNSYSSDGSKDRHAKETLFKDTPIYNQIRADILHLPIPDIENIILIGPDGSGKTTIAKILAEKLNYQYWKGTYKEDNKSIRALDLIKKRRVIFDRFYYPDDIIYSEIKGQPASAVDLINYEEVRKYMENTGVFIYVYVTCAPWGIKSRLGARGDAYVTFGEVLESIRKYQKFIKETSIPVMTVDTSTITPQQAADIILTNVKERRI